MTCLFQSLRSHIRGIHDPLQLLGCPSYPLNQILEMSQKSGRNQSEQIGGNA